MRVFFGQKQSGHRSNSHESFGLPPECPTLQLATLDGPPPKKEAGRAFFTMARSEPPSQMQRFTLRKSMWHFAAPCLGETFARQRFQKIRDFRVVRSVPLCLSSSPDSQSNLAQARPKSGQLHLGQNTKWCLGTTTRGHAEKPHPQLPFQSKMFCASHRSVRAPQARCGP